MPTQHLTPQQKKQLSYKRDHYVRAGESIRGWRRIKRVKKRNAVHVVRRKAKRAISEVELVETPGEAAGRQLSTIEQKKIRQHCVFSFGEFAKRAARRRQQG